MFYELTIRSDNYLIWGDVVKCEVFLMKTVIYRAQWSGLELWVIFFCVGSSRAPLFTCYGAVSRGRERMCAVTVNRGRE